MFGTLHVKYMQVLPDLLKQKGYNCQAEIVEKNMELLQKAVQAPDSDYQEYQIFFDLIPAELRKRIPRTSPIKFEHVLVDDVPKEIEDVLKKICSRFGIKYRYADETVNEWYKQAKELWPIDRQRALEKIGRCCHLIQDICVPMHVRVLANLCDVFDVFKNRDRNHNKYEKYCEEVFKLRNLLFDINTFEVPQTLREIAKETRTYIEMCDGIKFDSLWYSILKMLKIVKANEDYKTAADYSNLAAQVNTVLFVLTFFKEVGVCAT